MDEDATTTIADFLAGCTRIAPLIPITAGQRLYYNYRLDPPSYEAEIVRAGRRHERRDFRSLRERRHDGASDTDR